MNNPSEPNLVKVNEIFLVPSTFLVAALGAADTNLHRAMISVLGLVISVLWWVCSMEAFSDHLSSELTPPQNIPKRRMRLLSLLSLVFVTGWLASAAVHFMLWNRPLGS